MGEFHPQGRGDQRHRDDEDEGREVDRPHRVGRRAADRRQEETRDRRQRDHHAEPRRRRHGAVDRRGVKAHQRHAEGTAANPHQDREEPHHRREHGAQGAARHLRPDAPLRPSEAEIEGDDQRQGAEDRLKHRRAQRGHDQNTEHRADGDAGAPAPQDRPVDSALPVMQEERAQRGHDDRGERCRDADLHQVGPAIAKARERVEEGRDEHDPAADAEKPGDHAREGADGQQHDGHPQKVRRKEHGFS